MSGQFEKSQNSNNRKKLQNVGILEVRRHLLQNQVDVETQSRYVVDDVHAVKNKKKILVK